MRDPRTSYLSVPGRWKIVRALIIATGAVVALVLRHSHVSNYGSILIFCTCLTVVLWTDVWMFGQKARTYLRRVAALWTVLTIMVAALTLLVR